MESEATPPTPVWPQTPHGEQHRRVSAALNVVLSRRTLVTSDGQGVTLEKLIDNIGVGWYQLQVYILCFLVLLSEGAVLEMVASIHDVWIDSKGEVQVTRENSQLTSYIFVGVQIGTVLCGPISDTFGRRWPLICGTSGVIVMLLIMSFAVKTASGLYPVLIITGIFSGLGIPASFVFVAEVMPRHLRGVAAACMGLALRLGHLWSSVGLVIWMPDMHHGPWHSLVLWAGIPALVFVVTYFTIFRAVTRHDTAFFLAGRNKGRRLIAAINCMAEQNGKPEERWASGESIKDEPGASFWELIPLAFSRPMIFNAFILTFIFFGKEYCSVGFLVFFPKLMDVMPAPSVSEAQLLLIITAVGIPGVFLAMGVLGFCTRHHALKFGAIMVAISSILMHADKYLWSCLLGACLFQLAFPSWQMTTNLLPCEVFPTQVKTLWYGLVYFIGRFGGTFASEMVSASLGHFLWCMFGLAFLAACLVNLLPETSKTEMTELQPEGDGAKDAKGSTDGMLESGAAESDALAERSDWKKAERYGATAQDKGPKRSPHRATML